MSLAIDGSSRIGTSKRPSLAAARHLAGATAELGGGPDPIGALRGQSRRGFLRACVTSVLAPTIANCGGALATFEPGGGARLAARPALPTNPLAPGHYPLGLGGPRDGFLSIPTGYSADAPAPLVLGLHGAGRNATEQTRLLSTWYAARGFIILAVDSRDTTWDGISYRFGTDVAFIDSALRFAFDRCAVDPRRVIVEGFSDGASYALALAIANGDLFRRAVAFSPGFIPRSDSPAVGKPEFFVAHGRQDPVLPVEASRNQIVPDLRKSYSVEYLEFDGGHEVRPAVLEAAVTWFLRP